MPEWIWVAIFFAGYWIVMRWVLPRLGVQT